MTEQEIMAITGFGTLGGFIASMFIVFIILAVAVCVYQALALMNIAKRTKTKNEWLAWIPVGNLVLMANIAKMHWRPVLLLVLVFVPFINVLAIMALAVFYIIWLWKICEARKRPGWWAILIIIPWVGGIWMLIMLGILAWGK